MAQQVKVVLAKSNDLNSTPVIHMTEGDSHRLSSYLHTCDAAATSVPPHK